MDYLDDISYEEFMSDGSESESSTNLSSSSSMEHIPSSDACDSHGNETEHDFDEFDTLDIDTNADADSNSSLNEAESSSVVPEVNPTDPQTNSIVKDDTCNELKPTQISSPHVELKSQQKPINEQLCDKLYQQNVENTNEKLKDLTISESLTTPEASTDTKNSMDISNPLATYISNPSKSDPKLIELKDARLKLIKYFAETKQLSILFELLQLNDRITFIQGFDDIQIISSPSPSTEATPCSSTDKCYKQAATESPTSAAIIGNINDMNARYSYEQKILITGIEPHECPYTKILRRKTAAETHQEILEQFLKYAKIENPLIESEKAKRSCKDLFNLMPEAVKKSSCFSACPFGGYFTGEQSVDQVMPSESAASLPKPSSGVTAAAQFPGPGPTAQNPSKMPKDPLCLNDTQQPQPTTYSSKLSVEPGPCFNISPSKPTTTLTSNDVYERMKECEKMVLMLNDAKSRATTMPKYLQEHFERSIHEAETNLEVAKKDYEMFCKSLEESSNSIKAEMPKEQTLYFYDIDKLYQNMKNCEKIYDKLKSTEPGFTANHGHNEGLMGHFRNRLKEAESNWRNAQIQYNEYCAKEKLQKSLGALNSSTAYNEMKKQENLYANLMDAKNFNDGNCDEDKIEKTKLELEKAKELYEEASRFGQLNSAFSTPSILEASNSTAVKSGIEVKSGSQNLHKFGSEILKMSKVTNQMSFENIFNPDPTQMFATSNNKIQKIFATPEPGFQASNGNNEGLMGHFQNRLKEAGENERRQLLEEKKHELGRMRQASLKIFPLRRPNRLVSVEELASKVKSGSQNLHKLAYDSDVSKISKVTNQMNIFDSYPTQMFATSNIEIQKIFATPIHQHQQQQPLTESFKLQLEKNQEVVRQMQQSCPSSNFEQSVSLANLRKDDQKGIQLQMEESKKLFQQMQQSSSNCDQGVFLSDNSRTKDQIELKKLKAGFQQLQQTFQDTENARKTLIELNEKLQAENQWLRNDGNLVKEMEKSFKDSEKEFKNALEEKDSKIAKLEAELNQQLLNELKNDCEEEKMKAKKDAEIAKLLAENLKLKTLLASSSKPQQREQTTKASTQSCSIIPQSQLNILPTKYLKTFENVQNDHQKVVEWVNNAKTKASEIQAKIDNQKHTVSNSKTKAELEALQNQLKRQEYLNSKDSKKQLQMKRLEVHEAAKNVQRAKQLIKKPRKTSGSISMEEMMTQLMELQDSCGFNERHPELNGQFECDKNVEKQNLNQKMQICSLVKADNTVPSDDDEMLLYLRKVQEKIKAIQNSTTASAEPQRQESPEKNAEQRESSDFLKTYNGKKEIEKSLKHSIEPLEAVKINEEKQKEFKQNLSAELAKAQQQIEYYQKLAADQAEALKNFDLAKSLEKQLSEATQKADKALKALGKREAMDSVSRDLVLKRFKENDDDHSPVY